MNFFSAHGKPRTSVLLSCDEYRPLVLDVTLLFNAHLKFSGFDNTFKILNGFVDSKGERFKNDLKEILIKVTKGESKHPIHEANTILALFKDDEIKEFIRYSKLLNIPNLPDTFNEDIVKNDEGSKEQTYLKEDYLNLIVFLTKLKAILFVLANYSRNHPALVTNKHHILGKIIQNSDLNLTEGFIKIKQGIDKLTLRLLNNAELTAQRVISNGISKELISDYIIESIVIDKLLFCDETQDGVNGSLKTIITVIYNSALSFINLKETKNKLKIKRISNNDDGGEGSESVMDSRVKADLTIGFIQEFNFALEDIDQLITFFNLQPYKEQVYEVKKDLEVIKDINVEDAFIMLASWLFKEIIDPRAVRVLNLPAIINLLTITFVFLWNHDNKQLAVILTTGKVEEDVEFFLFNNGTRYKISAESSKIINDLFPYKKGNKSKSGIKYKCVVNTAITSLTKDLGKHRLTTLLNRKYVDEAFPNNLKGEIRLPRNIRECIASYCILTVNIKKFMSLKEEF